MIRKDAKDGLVDIHGNTVVWKYMDLPKFLNLVVNKKLFFANCASLTDQYEGLMPEVNKGIRKKWLASNTELSESEIDSQVEKDFLEIEERKKFTLLSCWSIDTEESYALWKIYLGGDRNGIAIRTTVKKLKDAIDLGGDSEDVYVGKVTYSDVIPKDFDFYHIITRKIPAYKYENELRLIIPRQFVHNDKEKIAKYPKGKGVHVDVDKLVDSIYVSPFSGKWFRSVLEQTLGKLNAQLVSRIESSGINEINS